MDVQQAAAAAAAAAVMNDRGRPCVLRSCYFKAEILF
jgi:hypothetical protein